MKYFRLLPQVLISFFGLALFISATHVVAAPFNEPITVGDITYVSGGIGQSDATAMRDLAKDYPLEIVFIQKLGQREELLAEVKLQLLDKQGKILLDVSTDGPYLLANLPSGRYMLVAEYNNVIKKRWVQVTDSTHKKINHKKVVFWWPIVESVE